MRNVSDQMRKLKTISFLHIHYRVYLRGKLLASSRSEKTQLINLDENPSLG